jgi:SRSO17 transposase
MEQRWRAELEAWLKPFLEALRHKSRARMCPVYVAGLIGAGDRKSIQPIAARDDEVGYDQLHHFIADGAWDTVPLEKVLLTQADKMVGGEEAWLIVDDTALPKKGDHSVGVAPQYASVLGKNANCQTLVSLTLAWREVPVMLGLRLFLPESWTSDQRRLNRARVPEEYRVYRTKPEIALQEIDRLRAAGVRFGCVLADAGYGLSAPFRQGLTQRGLAWAVGIPCKQKVYPVSVAMIFPVAGRGRARKRHIPDVASVAAQSMLDKASWRTISWRSGTKGRLKARFAALRVRVADGPPQRIGTMGAQHLPGDEAWLIGERRSTGECKYYLSNPASRHTTQAACRSHQGALGMRASASTAQGGVGARPLRRAIVDGSSSTRPHDHDRLRLLASTAPRMREPEKKESTARHLNPVFQPSERPLSPHSPDRRL